MMKGEATDSLKKKKKKSEKTLLTLNPLLSSSFSFFFKSSQGACQEQCSLMRGYGVNIVPTTRTLFKNTLQ